MTRLRIITAISKRAYLPVLADQMFQGLAKSYFFHRTYILVRLRVNDIQAHSL